MSNPLTIQKYLALNQGKYLTENLNIPQINSRIFITSHFETASTDLLHYHDSTHLSFILNGGVIDKRKKTEIEKTSGNIMFFHAGEPHQSIYKGFPVKNITIEFESNFFHENSITESKFKKSIDENLTSKFSFLKIYKEILKNDEFSYSSIELLLMGLLNGKSLVEKKRPFWLSKLVEILNDNWDKELSVSDLAAEVNVHPKTISKYFPRFFACTFGEYRRQLKIERSLALIKSSKNSLTDISYQCGFYDQSHFTSTFKHLTGFRPKQFKKL